MGKLLNAGSKSVVLPWFLLLGILPIQFLCFYWWSAESYYFSGDALFYFSRQIQSLADFGYRFLTTDELYQYRPLTYVFFTFVLHPLFGNDPFWYHATAYLFSTVNAVLACACIYYWAGKSPRLALFASIFLVLNPVHFFPSFGPTFIDQWLSSLFYFLALLLTFRQSGYARLLAAAVFLLALFSKEHSVMLPFHAVLIFAAKDVSLREALKRTANLWLVLAAFTVFQLVIRQGMIFAPEGNLQFTLSANRILELLKGAKPAFFYPENYLLDETIGFGRVLRLAMLIPLLAMVVAGIRRKPRLAVSGIAWLALSLAPVVFLQQPPAARHYYLGLPGLAILFACAIPSLRAIVIATPVLAILTVTNVHLYARESWVAVGSRLTKLYLGQIDEWVRVTGRSSFYVIENGDPHFAWYVDGGAALPHVLGRDASFRFAALNQPLETDKWLNNDVNVVLAKNGDLTDPVKAGQFPPPSNSNVCSLVRQITEVVGGCAVLFRGHPFEESDGLLQAVAPLPIFNAPQGVVTASRTTIRITADAGVYLRRVLELDSESVDGVGVEVFGNRNGVFSKQASLKINPGERREWTYSVAPDVFDYVFIRIHPNSDERNDWLVWEMPPTPEVEGPKPLG